MYGTITILDLAGPQQRGEVAAELGPLFKELTAEPHLLAAELLVTATDQVVLVTRYRSMDEAEALSARVRPRLAAIVGPHLAVPPRRVAGPIVLTLAGTEERN